MHRPVAPNNTNKIVHQQAKSVISVYIIFPSKYTNPARGIIDFCKQKFYRPLLCSPWTLYSMYTPCYEVRILHVTPRTVCNTPRILCNTPRTLRNTTSTLRNIHWALRNAPRTLRNTPSILRNTGTNHLHSYAEFQLTEILRRTRMWNIHFTCWISDWNPTKNKNVKHVQTLKRPPLREGPNNLIPPKRHVSNDNKISWMFFIIYKEALRWPGYILAVYLVSSSGVLWNHEKCSGNVNLLIIQGCPRKKNYRRGEGKTLW